MQAAVFASTPAMAASLQCVLGGLHEQKTKDVEVDALLTRLYRPILFRSLSAANACIRRNALLLLLEAFPLQVHKLYSPSLMPLLSPIKQVSLAALLKRL